MSSSSFNLAFEVSNCSLIAFRSEECCEMSRSKRVRFVVTYSPMLPNIPKILHEAHPILHASERCTEIFKNVPLVSYQRARNLNDILCSKRLASPKSHSPIPSQTCQNNNDSPPPNTNQCPECGLKLNNSKGLKIHQSSVMIVSVFGFKMFWHY